jgi:hypothetical protein
MEAETQNLQPDGFGNFERVHKELCGCEFTEFVSGDLEHSFCTLTKCRCKRHYEEQFIAEWYDEEGHHCEEYEPQPLIPLEVAK